MYIYICIYIYILQIPNISFTVYNGKNTSKNDITIPN